MQPKHVAINIISSWNIKNYRYVLDVSIRDHIDGSPAQGMSDWVLNDFAIVSWYDATVTPSTLEIVETRHATALSLWRSIHGVFRDNRA